MRVQVLTAYLAVGTIMFFSLGYVRSASASEDLDLPSDTTSISATRPFVVLGGAPRELYDVGDRLTITANFTAHNRQNQIDVVVIVEVRDSADITTLLYAEPGSIPQGNQLDIAIPWVPEKADAYLIKAYAISDLTAPRLLSNPQYWKSMVIEPGANPDVDAVLVGNQTNGLPRLISKTNISNTPIGSSHSYMYVQNDTICIVWLEVPPGIDYDPPGTPPMYRISHDAGATFSETAELGSSDIEFCNNFDSSGIAGEAQIELNETHTIMYHAGGRGQEFVSLTAFIHNGSMSIPYTSSQPLAYSEKVKDILVLAEGNSVYVFWSDIPWGQTERQLFFASSSDFGKHVETTELRSRLNGNAIYPTQLHLFSANNTVLLLWSDMVGYETRTEANHDWKILVVRGTDRGTMLSGLVDLMPDAFQVFDPQLSFSNGNLYLIWREHDSDKPSDIFFAKSTDFGLTFTKG